MMVMDSETVSKPPIKSFLLKVALDMVSPHSYRIVTKTEVGQVQKKAGAGIAMTGLTMLLENYERHGTLD